MTHRNNDTDPSTPVAMRATEADTDPLPRPPPTPTTTQRGLGPASQPPAPPTAVRPQAPVGPKKDSVELLLDGMAEPSPTRPRTTPQTDGQASASYHAEHTVRPAHTDPGEEPSVVVERPPQARTIRIDRAAVEAAKREFEAKRRAEEEAKQLPQSLKVAIAVVAGLAVVLVIFLLVHKTDEPVAASAPSAPSVAAPVPPPAPTPAPPPVNPSTATAAALASEPGTAAATATASATVNVSELPPAPSSRPRPRPSATPSNDLGEFKPNF